MWAVVRPQEWGNQRKLLCDLFDASAAEFDMGRTRWAALQAVTAYTTHHRGRDTASAQENRLRSSWFGSADKLNKKALDWLLG